MSGSIKASDGMALDKARTEAMLQRLGFKGPPTPDLAGLEELYVAWLQNVPFCSSRKRLHYGSDVTRPDPLPAADAASFVDGFLAHGCGGTCFPSAEAWFQLLLSCGFSARRALGSMLDFPQIPGPNHGTVVVDVAGGHFMVDPFFGSETPLALDDGPHRAGRAAVEIRSEPVADTALPHVHWRFHNARQWFRFGFAEDWPVVTHSDFVARYEASGGSSSVFNNALYISRHVGSDVHTIFKGEHFVLSADDSITRQLVNGDRDQLLVEVFGLSPDFARRIPLDIDVA